MFHPSTCKDIFRSTSHLPTIVATNDVTYKFGLLKCYWCKYFDRDLHHAYEHELLGQHLFALPCVLYLSLNISKYLVYLRSILDLLFTFICIMNARYISNNNWLKTNMVTNKHTFMHSHYEQLGANSHMQHHIKGASY